MLLERLQEYCESETKKWTGTFREYLDLVRENPKLTMLSHARVYEMIVDMGYEVRGTEKNKVKVYNFFREEIFGIEDTLEKIVDYFYSASMGLDTRRRILLFVGPPGSGKSTVVTLLKKGLERFSHTPKGYIYAIKDCPLHEDPLHLIPTDLRKDFEKEYNITIEGDLCPVCTWRLQNEWKNDILNVGVEQIFLSEALRIGIGTFTPSDEKNMDISDLVGSVDLSKIKIYGTESHPLCWKFDGELDIANRGIIEFIEGLKVPDEFLYCLLWLAQERQIKTSRFPLTYADEVIIMHTNETEYKRFMNDKKNEALQNRTIAIKVPYNLKLSEEVRIYDKLLKQGHLGDIHIAPHALEVASLLAIASRLGKSEKLPLIKKIRLYNGESIEGYTEKEVKEIKEEFKDEGMFGISPRQIINSIAEAIAKTNKKCVSPIDVLRSIRDNFDKHIETQKMDKQYLDSLVFTVREEYDDIIKKEIQKVYIYAFEEQADALFRKYLDHIEAFVNKQKIIDPITEEEKDPDENFMRSIEEQIGVSTSSKSQFREDILIKLSSAAKRGETFRYNSHPRLKEAIEKKLFSDVKDTLRLTVSAILPDQEQKKKLDDLTNRLIQDHGYCKSCATEAIKYVSELLNK